MNVAGKTVVSKADLLRLYGALGEASLDHISSFSGYFRKPDTKKPLAIPPVLELKSSTRIKRKVSTIELSLDQKIDMPFWRPLSSTSLISEENKAKKPKYYIEAEPFQDKEIRADRSVDPPSQQPLCPWSQLWPFLRAALGAYNCRSAVDIPQVVRWAAQMRPMRRLPRMQRRGWSRRSMLIVDLDTRLVPFWQDMYTLYRHLARVRSENGLDLISFEHGPCGPAHKGDDDGSPSRMFTPPEPETPILIISDLGLFGHSEHLKKEWLRFGRQLRRSGCAPVVLTPVPRRLWTDESAGVYKMACWDRGQCLPKIGSRISSGSNPLTSNDAHHNGTNLLISLLSPAIRVEPALLRAARSLLPIEQADAGDEAAVWHHDYVRCGYTGFSFDPQHIADLRKAFVRDHTTELQQRACALIRAHHRHLSPAVAQEERLIAEILLHGRPPEDAEKFFWSSLKTLSQPDFRERAGLEAWMQRVMKRQEQDPGMWQSQALCAIWAKANYENWTLGKIALPKGLDPASVTWLWVQERPVQSYTLFRRGRHFFAEKQSQSESSDAAPYSAGSPVIDLISSDGVLQVREIDSNQSAEYVVNLRNPETVPIRVPDKEQLRLTTTHHEIVLKCTGKPSWADGWGRNEQGLFIILPHEEQTRKAYWFAPGRYPVGDYAAGLEVLDDPGREGLLDGGTVFDIKKGFWWDEYDFRQSFRNRFQKPGYGYNFGYDYGSASYYGFQKPEWTDDFGVDQYGIFAEFHVRNAVQHMRWIMPDEFIMGSPQSEPERLNDEQRHLVILTRGFWLADTACTQALWQAVMGDNPSDFKGDDRPVDSVRWDDCQAFIEKINAMIPGLELYLPTEAQWEYACRAGTTTPFHFGENITIDQVNFNGNYPYNEGKKGEYRDKTVSVKSFGCNDWGLYEMHGNVWEWCADWYGDYPPSTVVDPVGPQTGDYRVLRGGSWIHYGRYARSAKRNGNEPAFRYHFNGFRVARGQTAGKLSGESGQSMGGV